ncbi:zinc finger, C2H2-like, DNA-binding domain protein [Tanacetum coccineum]
MTPSSEGLAPLVLSCDFNDNATFLQELKCTFKGLSQLKTNGANPSDEEAMMLVEGDNPMEFDLLHTNPIQNVAAEDEGLGEINVNGKKIDLLYLARDASDDFEANLNKTTEGMVKEAEFIGVLKDLEGVWSSKKKRRKFMEATIFGDSLPENLRIMLAFRPLVYPFSLLLKI